MRRYRRGRVRPAARLAPSLVLALALGIGAGSQGLADTPRTVCSVTLHSEDEIAALRSRLPANEFEFVELTELTGEPAPAAAGSRERSQDGWLGAACRSGIRCDVLVVSGHFGGSFFGSSGRTLGLADLEAHACRQDCAGVLSDPTEVFLLGCNTAASKARDHRSPDEYLQALRDDGISRRSAERIVESRYGALGTSFRARMERVFAGVPRLYGFGSVAPAGPTAARALAEYLDEIDGDVGPGGYGAHLERMAAPGPNRALARAFDHTTFVEFEGMSREGEAAARRELVCSLYDEARPAPERLEIVEAMAGDPAFLSYVPSIERFFDAYPRWSLEGPRAEAALARLERLAQPRAELLERLEALRAPTLRGELAHVAASLGWIDTSRHRRIARQAVVELFDPEMGPEERSAICELAPRLGDVELDGLELAISSVWTSSVWTSSVWTSSVWTSSVGTSSVGNAGSPVGSDAGSAEGAARYAAQALLCLEPRQPELRGHMAVALDDERWSVRARALETLARLEVDDPRVWAAAARRLAEDPRSEVRVEAARALGRRAEREGPGALSALTAALRDPEAVVRAAAARSLGSVGGRPEALRGLAGALADGDWQVQFAAASALGEIARGSGGLAEATGVEHALVGALDAPSWFVRYKVAETLAEIRTPRAGLAGGGAEG